MEPGHLGTNGPTRWRTTAGGRGPIFGPGAERSTGRGCVNADDSEDEARRAAGGPGPKSSTRTERGALTDLTMAVFRQQLSKARPAIWYRSLLRHFITSHHHNLDV